MVVFVNYAPNQKMCAMEMWEYDIGYEDARLDAQTQANTVRTTGNLFFLLALAILALIKPVRRISYWIIVCRPALIAAYWMTSIWKTAGSAFGLAEVGIITALGYLLACLLHFVKGIVISYKEAGRGAWITLWTICILVAAGLPILFLQPVFESWIESGRSISLNIQPEWSWAGAFLAGLIVVWSNRFLKDGSIVLTRWSYQAGRELAYNQDVL